MGLFRSVKDKSYFWAKFLKKKRILDKFNSSKYSVLGKNFTVYVTKKSGGKLEAPGVCEGGHRYPKKLYSSIHTPVKLTENLEKRKCPSARVPKAAFLETSICPSAQLPKGVFLFFWKRAFARVPGAPECPQPQSQPYH